MVEPDHGGFGRARLIQALADELDTTRDLVEDLAVVLCLDPVVLQRHPKPLQQFDKLAQVIGEVSRVLRHAGPSDQAIAAVRLDELRTRLVGACEPA